MGIIDQPVKDGIGDGGIADLFMPVLHGELTGDHGGGMAVSFFKDLQEVSSFGVGHGSKAEIVNHQDMGLGMSWGCGRPFNKSANLLIESTVNYMMSRTPPRSAML